MTSNRDKFIDRFPTILAAGKGSDSFGDSVASCFRNYPVDEIYQALKHAAQQTDKENKVILAREPYKNNARKGIFTDIRPSMRPDNQTTYEILINELKETNYDSHWNKTVGHGRYQVPGLPKGFDILAKPFGTPTKSDVTLKELVNPPKGVYQVLTESQVGHENYRRTHNDYNVGERIERNYESPPYDKHKRFGAKTKYDPRGIWVRCACHWHESEPVVFSNKVQADFVDKYRSKLGKALTPNKIHESLPEDYVFGTPMKKELYNVEELLKDGDCPPCLFKQDLKCWLSSFNKLRDMMKRRCNNGFNFDDLYKKLLYYDSDHSGNLSLELFYKVCGCYNINFDRKNLEQLLQLLSVVQGDLIDYVYFLQMIDYKKPPIELMKVQDIPPNNQYYVSSTQAATCDYLIINNANMPTAGIPSVRHDLPRPVVPPHGCRADLDNLSQNTTAGLLISPSIYSNYGLNYRDFFMPRQPQLIRTLFENAGYSIDDATFDDLWKKGVELDKTGLVCIETFNKLLNTHYPEQRKLVVDEATC